MAGTSPLKVSNLPPASPEEASATTSPARGAEMRNFLQTRLQKNRAPPLVHSWDFWHDRQERIQNGNTTSSISGAEQKYEERLEILASISDLRAFWSVFNNFDLSLLQLRDSIHLFHKGIKPIWEDPRNTRGGSWTFRVPKAQAAEFWKETCMMAIGELLQAALETDQSGKLSFRDEICGVSLSVRFNSVLVRVWNRDADHEVGIAAVSETMNAGLGEQLMPKEGSAYYKRHNEHAGFSGDRGRVATTETPNERTGSPIPVSNPTPGRGGEQGMQSLDAIVDEHANGQ